MNYNDTHEETLFSSKDSDIQTETLFSSGTVELEEETLFTGGAVEDISFEEPIAPTPTASVETIKFADVEAETLYNANPSGEVELGEETLFSGDISKGVEETSVYKDNVRLEEETISLDAPEQAENLNEETLFSEVSEEPAIEVTGESDVFTEELSSLSGAEELSLIELGGAKPQYIERNFARKLLDSEEIIIQRYEELKNYILSFKKVKSRISNDFDSFNMGRTQLFKLGVSMKSLKLYLNLDFNEVESRLKCKYAGEKKAYASVPVFLRIKSDRAMRNAKYLIDQVAMRFELQQSLKVKEIDARALLEEKAKSYN